MRVIGGQYRSRALKSVSGLDTRPTPDRLRESLFNILAPEIEGARFADLYAGTGAVGIEALSRGASHAIFVEQNRVAVGVIRENVKSLGATARADVRQGKAAALASRIAADIVFLDPPYGAEKEYEVVMNALGDHPFVICQHDRRLKLAERYGALELTRTVRQGDNVLSFYRKPI